MTRTKRARRLALLRLSYRALARERVRHPCSRNVLMSVPRKIEVSPWRPVGGLSRVVPDDGGADEQGGTLARRHPRPRGARRAAGRRGGLAAGPERAAGDRKSTRLNSSHAN